MRTSVIIANYNYGAYLAAAIDSVLNQTDPVDEIVVVDDGSTDNSRDIIAGYGAKIVPILQDNAGQAAALSAGFARATGDIVMLLDSDDVFFPDKNRILKQVYKYYPDIGWAFHDLKHLRPGEDGNPAPAIGKAEMIDERANMRRGHLDYLAPATSGLSMRRAFLESLFPLPVAQSIYVSDHYIKFFCLARGTGLHLKDRLGGQLIHGANLYTGANQKAMAARARIFVNTAYFLHRIAAETALFCDSIMAEGLTCGYRAGIIPELRERAGQFLRSRPLPRQYLVQARARVKSLISA